MSEEYEYKKEKLCATSGLVVMGTIAAFVIAILIIIGG